MRTSSPSRWTCTRAPSSFHSTDAVPVWPERLRDVGGTGREHRLDRVQHGQPDGLEGLAALGQGEHRRAAEVAREHRGAADDVDRDPRRGGDGIGHHPGQRALAELAGEQPADEVDLGLGGAGEEIREQCLAGGLRPRTRRAGQLGEDPVDLEDLDRGLGGGLDVLPVRRSPAHADATLARRAGEEPDRDLDLVGVQRAQELGERLPPSPCASAWPPRRTRWRPAWRAARHPCCPKFCGRSRSPCERWRPQNPRARLAYDAANGGGVCAGARAVARRSDLTSASAVSAALRSLGGATPVAHR